MFREKEASLGMEVCEAAITIGEILKPVGLRGEVKVFPLTNSPERFEALQEINIQTERGELVRHTISGIRYKPPFVYLCFSGLMSVEQVEFLRRGMLQISEAERISLPEGYYFQSELSGMSVHLKEGAFLGTVSSVLETGENDLLIVKEDQKEYLIPVIKKIVKKIDLEQKRIIIDPIEGLLDI